MYVNQLVVVIGICLIQIVQCRQTFILQLFMYVDVTLNYLPGFLSKHKLIFCQTISSRVKQ